MRRALVAFSPALLYAGVIFYLSAQSNPLPFLPPWVLAHDKLLHFLEYAGLAALLVWGLLVLGASPGRAFVLALVLASAYGASDEIHQYFVPDRQCDVHDWLADTVGAGLGAGLASAVLRRLRSRASIRN